MRKETLKPMPFPGESPTISLAMAAGQKYGLQDEEKPARSRGKRAKAAGKQSTPARTAATRAQPGKAATRAKPRKASTRSKSPAGTRRASGSRKAKSRGR